MISIKAIPAFQDNYIWCITRDNKHAFVVDPGDAEAVTQHLVKHQMSLAGILITHHHADHTGGITELLNTHGLDIPVYGPLSRHIPQITQPVSEGELFIKNINSTAEVLSIPGHTLDHIAYLIEGHLFCGDTLFSGGCGRIFEGTPEQMTDSLSKITKLSPETMVYCAHEYTQSNMEFAVHVDPENKELAEYFNWVKQQRNQNQITLPSTIKQELKINPFLRCDNPLIQQTICREYPLNKLENKTQYFAQLRKWKDNF
ncbi:hydroxyacylglutathione hydrolase [Parashewanella spongiae]|uniref:Hydroxyacylglutathione hydrolase n=1 Tax=Parashewanella spongiae TaxID=342950 RepID=A0A3A6TCX2_9GAMM|nr:hydroxyacylglutathione hydrolase [Parashewanella spongiae]MCL1078675.1 hydroxyacylglutathione hydrolase [Parashewanella spongiae]RJY12952.1 hydroxyacylglutathione hydrolase [Parashewanella spongiae]